MVTPLIPEKCLLRGRMCLLHLVGDSPLCPPSPSSGRVKGILCLAAGGGAQVRGQHHRDEAARSICNKLERRRRPKAAARGTKAVERRGKVSGERGTGDREWGTALEEEEAEAEAAAGVLLPIGDVFDRPSAVAGRRCVGFVSTAVVC